ncbi:hypothetical protein LTR95_011991, partial [Oleoguttula sp. CCFEE 5521]
MSGHPHISLNGQMMSGSAANSGPNSNAPSEPVILSAEQKAAQHAARKEEKKSHKPVKEFSIGTLTLYEVSQALRLVPPVNSFLNA